MTPDEQEALSHKYGNGVVMVLRLQSGAYAVFNAARELQAIVPAKTTLASLRVTPPVQPTAVPAPAPPTLAERLKAGGLLR